MEAEKIKLPRSCSTHSWRRMGGGAYEACTHAHKGPTGRWWLGGHGQRRGDGDKHQAGER